MDENAAITVVFPSLFSAVSFTAWSVATNVRRTRVARALVDMQAKMLEKMPPEELPAYAASEAGKAILKLDAGRAGSPQDRILNAITAGLVIGLVGMAMFAVHHVQVNEETRRLMQTLGAVGMAAGAGLLLSAFASYLLSKAWGLFEESK